MGILSNDVESLAAEIDEGLELIRRLFASVDHVSHVGGQNDRSSIPFHVAKLLHVPEELAKIDVEQVPGRFQHDVVVVAVTDAQNVSGNAIPSARCCVGIQINQYFTVVFYTS